MAGNLAPIIVLALGAGALGGPDAVSLLLAVAGQSAVVDIAICVFLIAAATAPILGTVLLSLFFRKARVATGAGGGALRAAATDVFARMTLMVSMSVASLVTACLLAALFVELGGAEKLRLLVAFAGTGTLVPAGAGAGAATAAAALILGTAPLARLIRGARAGERSRKIALLVALAGAFLLAGRLAPHHSVPRH